MFFMLQREGKTAPRRLKFISSPPVAWNLFQATVIQPFVLTGLPVVPSIHPGSDDLGLLFDPLGVVCPFV